jgi:hypothetical protein
MKKISVLSISVFSMIFLFVFHSFAYSEKGMPKFIEMHQKIKEEAGGH